jgi:hypothetical protein
VDLPGGGGKIRLSEERIAGEGTGWGGGKALFLRGDDGRLWPYPADETSGKPARV